MEQLTTANGRKVINYASILEDNTREQALKTASLPFIYPHLALMPDAHLGKGATVGSVIPTEGAIIPAAVGVDIGCGMMAVRTQFTLEDLRERVWGHNGDMQYHLGELHASIAGRIPLSAGKYNTSLTATAEVRVDELVRTPGIEQAVDVSSNWQLQLGSLGSGNHFIEVSVDEDGRVWLFLHSGSRGVGNKLAQVHIAVAQKQARRRHYSLPDPDLAYLVEGEPEFDAYIEALQWAQKFAELNRAEMMDRTIAAFEEWLGEKVQVEDPATDVVQCHHNYTEPVTLDLERRGKSRDVWLSRKGAIDATAGRLGLIPGSMGAASYVVEGLGDKLSLNSAPHGAGRNHSRSAAKKLFTREDLDARMAGVAWGNSDAFLDEHPDAYKDVDVVMRDAERLVRPLHTLRQIVNVKGD